ncbi:MAG: 4Fe-4S binding protein, partial [Kiritimatiellae bacterium]|nr:4Fe-4S binding protein [Kiritimatiellia bacterium]
MNAPSRNRPAHLLRLAACLLMLAAAAVAGTGRVFGHALSPALRASQPNPTALFFRPVDLPTAAALLVLLLAATVPLFAKSRIWRTIQLVLDVAVLGLWSGLYLSLSRLVGWSGASLPDDAAHSAAALLMLSMAFLYPLFGRPSHYCLHACPFGAAQELAGLLPLPKWHLPQPLVRALVFFRRALWAALMLALWCGPFSAWTGWELFGAFAWRAVPPLLAALALVFVVLAAFVPRPYCRFVCPTGTLFKLAETNHPGALARMKAANFLNVLLAAALLMLCARLCLKSAPPSADTPSAPPADAVVIDSTLLAPGVTGYGGPVPVEVEIRDGLVARISPKLPNDETPAFFQRLEASGFWQSWDGLPVAEAATARVDAVSSATYSSKAAIANVRAALASAAGLPAPEPPPADEAPADRPHHAHRHGGPHGPP